MRNAALRRAVGEARDRLHGRFTARAGVLGAAAASVPAAACAAWAWFGGPSWAAAAAVGAGAGIGALAGALTRVTPAEAAVALDHTLGAADRLASAWEADARGAGSELETRLVEDGVRALRPAVFPWSFRRRDALAALAAAALALAGIAAPARAMAPPPAAGGGARMLSEESARIARSAAESGTAAREAGSEAAAAAADAAARLAETLATRDPGAAAAEAARLAAELRAEAATVRHTSPEGARALERLADRLEATGSRLAHADGAAPAGTGGGELSGPGGGAAVVRGPVVTGLPVPRPPADLSALRRPDWPPEYDEAVGRYFSGGSR